MTPFAQIKSFPIEEKRGKNGANIWTWEESRPAQLRVDNVVSAMPGDENHLDYMLQYTRSLIKNKGVITPTEIDYREDIRLGRQWLEQ